MKTTKTSHGDLQFIEKKLELFDKTFHERIWRIVKQVNPSSYATAETFGMLESDSPQIYGEMKEFISQALTDQAKEILAMEELKEENKLPDQYMRANRDIALRNDVRSQIKAAIREKYLK